MDQWFAPPGKLPRFLTLQEKSPITFQYCATQPKMHQLENQMRQVQRMEALGRLAGGIAHDFNNLLTVISGYAELTLDTLNESDPLREDIYQISTTAEHASALTRQLLLFSRRQIVQPQLVDLNAIIETMAKMLRRVIGEDIHLILKLTPEPVTVKIDPGQFEQVVMNLVVNARDAMPDGGLLTIETDRITLHDYNLARLVSLLPGDFIRLIISDTGLGINEEIVPHIFEPFFTTKMQGHGTGLGLSTVYAIITQAEGSIQERLRPNREPIFWCTCPLKASQMLTTAKW